MAVSDLEPPRAEAKSPAALWIHVNYQFRVFFWIILDLLASEWFSGVPGGPFGIQGEVGEIRYGPRMVLEGSGVVLEKHHFLFFQT